MSSWWPVLSWCVFMAFCDVFTCVNGSCFASIPCSSPILTYDIIPWTSVLSLSFGTRVDRLRIVICTLCQLFTLLFVASVLVIDFLKLVFLSVVARQIISILGPLSSHQASNIFGVSEHYHPWLFQIIYLWLLSCT